MPRALMIAVGTGDAAELETLLFVPLRLSICHGDWAQVALLPSDVSGQNAQEVRRRRDAEPIGNTAALERDLSTTRVPRSWNET